ncbi:unnamed protein product [Parnassius apollo]|uniref:(apollo) hypothetical protein n=1 Tax=Parnassius apollo TaxID=110799 RepID=A0A8S3XLA3_PARAO|nr:unnamed protein product [Parnassius apollo]
MEEDERRLSFPPPAPLNSPGEEIDGSRLLGEIVRTLEATNPEAAAPLAASQSRDALATECEKPRRDQLRIPLDVTFANETVGGRDEPRAVVTPFTRESAKRAGSRGAQLVREFGFMPRRRLSVEDGARLPRKYEPFPPKLYGRPLEEIDNFIYDELPSSPASPDSVFRKPGRQSHVPYGGAWGPTDPRATNSVVQIRLKNTMASRHLNLEQISNLLNEDEEEPFDESDDELGIGEHLPELQNDNSDSKQRETDSEDEAGSSLSQYYIGRDKQTKWSKNSSSQRIRQRAHNIVLHLPGPKGEARNVMNLHI